MPQNNPGRHLSKYTHNGNNKQDKFAPPDSRGPNGHKPNSSTNPNGNKAKPFYSYSSLEAIEEKMALGQCFSGIYKVNNKTGEEGYITLADIPIDLFIPKNSPNGNRAISGDTVAFRVKPSNYWWLLKSISPLTAKIEIEPLTEGERSQLDRPSQRMLLLREAIAKVLNERNLEDYQKPKLPAVWHQAESPEEAKSLIKEVTKHFPELRPVVEVIRIMENSPKRNSIVGVLSVDEETQKTYLLPLDSTLPKKFAIAANSLGPDQERLCAEAADKNKRDRTILKARFLRWGENEAFPVATLQEIIGKTGSIEIETRAILSAHNIKDKPFTERVLKCLPDSDWVPSASDLEDRSDFRGIRVFSIDPPTARDMDDALSIETLGTNRFRVGVHIADVSHFVKPGTELDIEAQNRTTSVYLVQRVIPMLPELLSSRLCSLQPGKDRLTFSVVWEMTGDGEVLKQVVTKGIIKSCSKLSYGHAQAAIEDPNAPKPEGLVVYGDNTWEQIKQDILSLCSISRYLRKKRFNNGALRLNLPKISFTLDASGMPMEAEAATMGDANHLIEEFMLLANMTAAKIISDMYPGHALLRMHPSPNLFLMEDLKEVAGGMAIDFDISSASSVQSGLLELYSKCTDQEVIDAVTNIAARPMQLAEYFCTGLYSRENWRHYALAVNEYTHFTSPIRRYPDVIVHRMLHTAITVGASFNKELCKEDSLKVQETASNCNRGKRAARNAQDQSQHLFLTHWLEKNPQDLTAVVLSVKGSRFFDVYVPRLSITSRIECESLPGNPEAVFDKETSVLTIRSRRNDQDDGQSSKEKDEVNREDKSYSENPDGTVHADFEHLNLEGSPKEHVMAREQLSYPFQLTRFCKVPVKVWVERCPIFGKLREIKVDLKISDV